MIEAEKHILQNLIWLASEVDSLQLAFFKKKKKSNFWKKKEHNSKTWGPISPSSVDSDVVVIHFGVG